MRRKQYVLASTASVASLALFAPAVHASYYTVDLTAPACTEWTEDVYGGIWNANIAEYDDGGNLTLNTTGLIMCTGDYHDIYTNTVTGPYTPYNLITTTPTQLATDPGNYQFNGGFGIGNRTPDVVAKVSYLVDQMNNSLTPPADGNYQGLNSTNWTECKGDALVAAIHNLWDGVPPSFEGGPDDPDKSPEEAAEYPVESLEYSQYMTAVANINASNYTSSDAIWLTDPVAQVLFANLTPDDLPADPISVPEPATLSLLAVGSLALLHRKRRIAVNR